MKEGDLVVCIDPMWLNDGQVRPNYPKKGESFVIKGVGYHTVVTSVDPYTTLENQLCIEIGSGGNDWWWHKAFAKIEV